jgi:hypothetical protein
MSQAAHPTKGGGKIDEATSIEIFPRASHDRSPEIEEHVRKYEENIKHYIEEHKEQHAQRVAPEFRRAQEVVGERAYRIDLSAGGIVQEGCCDDCAEPGFEEGVAEGTVFGNADADLLCESCRKEP